MHAVLFRSECRKLLHPADFTTVDALYRAAFADGWAATEHPQRKRHPLHLARCAHRWFDQLADEDAVMTAMRGIQAAGLRNGWHIDLDEKLLRRSAVIEPRNALIQPADWPALHGYVRTDLPALCAVVAAGIGLKTASALRMNQTDKTGTTITVGDAKHRSPSKDKRSWPPTANAGNSAAPARQTPCSWAITPNTPPTNE